MVMARTEYVILTHYLDRKLLSVTPCYMCFVFVRGYREHKTLVVIYYILWSLLRSNEWDNKRIFKRTYILLLYPNIPNKREIKIVSAQKTASWISITFTACGFYCSSLLSALGNFVIYEF